MKNGEAKHGEPVSRIRIQPPRQEGTWVRLEGELTTGAGSVHRVYFEFTAPDDRPYELRARPFLLAFLLPAMQAGAPLELELPVDETTLNNLMEWQSAMASWQPPGVLKVIPIRAPRGAGAEKPHLTGALTAFSGGVDSNFTLWRHTQTLAEPNFRKAELRAGLMVHGFDIAVEQEQEFERAWSHSRATLESYGLAAYRLKTNVRSFDKLPGCRWGPMAHGSWLAASLSCYEPWFGRVLIPSTFVYTRLLLPWGSNPVTDPLLSSATTTYWHDGCAYNKFTKMRFIATLPVVQKHLRVCWQNEPVDSNCGKCWKCMATQVCFQLAGVERPETFPIRYTLAQLARIDVERGQEASLLREMRGEARRQGRKEISRAMNRALVRERIARWFRRK